MRIHIVLTLTAILMAFSTGYFALFLKGSYSPTYDDSLKINRLGIEFQRRHESQARLDFSNQVVGMNKVSLIETSYTFPRSPEYADYQVYSSTKNCQRSFLDYGAFSTLMKNKIGVWDDFRCNRRRLLPKGYFTTSPYIHPSGKSYVYLAYKLLKSKKRKKDWVRKYFYYFHVDEIEEFIPTLKDLGPPYNYMHDLGVEGIKGVFKNQRMLGGEKFLLMRTQGLFSESVYNVYEMSKFKEYVLNSSYQIRPYQAGRKCFYREGNLCWEYNLRHLYSLANTSTIIFFMGSLAIIILVILILFARLKSQRIEDERRRMALQVLTHEFRTPVASMLLQIEEMKKNYDDIGENIQDSFFRLCDDVFRLQRLTEKSKNYLNALKGKQLILVNKNDYPSTNELFESLCAPFLEDHPENFSMKLLENDMAISIDSYWLAICLKNLIENAFAHGQPPVTLELEKSEESKSDFIIRVIDSGPGSEKPLSEMTTPFVKGNKSEGSGLGLNIVNKVIEEIGGKLDYQSSPSTFTLTLPHKVICVKKSK